LEVEFGGRDFTPGGGLRYQHKLDGTGGEWSSPSESRSVHLASLTPGNYRLLVRAVDVDGQVSAQASFIQFHVVPPVWLRWWFLVFSIAGVAGIAYAAHRYRLAQAVALERLRTRIASDLHDDIGSNLSVIAGLSEVLRQQARRSDPQMTEPLAVIATVSNRSMDAMADIVWAIDPRKDHLRDLAQRMRRWANDALTGRQIELSFNAPSEDLTLNAEMRREIFLLFKEAVHNVVRHSDCTEASVDLRRERDSLVLEVGDNGNGFTPDQATQGQGLASMQRRAAKLGGVARVQSQGRGTCVLVRVPLRDKSRCLETT
jgi:signal transduction histidine kinase